MEPTLLIPVAIAVASLVGMWDSLVEESREQLLVMGICFVVGIALIIHTTQT